MVRFSGILILAISAGLLTGCSKSSTPLGGKSTKSPGEPAGGTAKEKAEAGGPIVAPPGWEAPEVADGKWVGYPNVPYVPITQEVGDIDVPRVFDPPEGYKAGGEVPVDKNNPAAKGKTTQPVTGGSIAVRFNAEPKTLNPITESSAYQTYISQYTHDTLLWQNPETFEWEPHVAHKWVVEDSVKLRPDYEGSVRQVAEEAGEPAKTLQIEIKSAPKDGEEELQPVKLTVSDAEGKPIPDAWVGLRKVGGTGEVEQLWTKDDGTVEALAPEAGKYDVLVGDELYGELQEKDGGYLLVSKTDEDAKPIELAKEDVIDVQRGTVFTYYLRDDVTWSDGTPFTSKDLEFANAVINNPFVDGDQIRVYYSDVVEVDGIDDYTVRMKYRKQYFQALEFTAGLSFYTPPLHLFEQYVKEKGKELTFERLDANSEGAQNKWSVHGQEFGKFFNQEDRYSRKPMGIGPYIVDEWSQQDRRLVLKRRENYWNDEHAGHLDQIIIKFIEDTPTALQALRAGEIDFFWRATPEQFYEELDPAPKWVQDRYVKADWFSPSFRYIGWNLKKPIFQDHRVRLALAMLFDKPDFFEKKVHGSGVMVSGSQYYFGPAYDHSVGTVGYDPQGARDLLADAGWIDTDGDGILDKGGKPFRFTFLYPPGSPLADAMVEMLQRGFRQAGIVMEVQRMEWAAFIERLQSRDFDAVTLAWASTLESDPYQIWHSSGAGEGNRGSNHVGFANKQADELITKARVALDPEERKRLFYSLHRVLDREQPYTFLWTEKDLGLYHQKFRGVKFYALRPGFDLREWYIPKELQ